MPLLNTKHKRKSFALTTLLLSALLLVLFYLGLTYLDPPEENGITVNLGSMEIGMGEVQPKTSKSELHPEPETELPDEVRPVNTEELPSKTAPTTEAAPEVPAEKVLTQNQEESIRIKQQEEARNREKIEAQRKAEAERKQAEEIQRKAAEEAARLERERQAAQEAKRREQEEKKRKLDALMGGLNAANGNTSGSEGDDNRAGDKGSPDGNPYATTYYGSPGSGSGNTGYGLNGRSLVGRGQESQKCNQQGSVVVQIVVNRNGEVVEATPGVRGTTNSDPCLLLPAKATAMSYRWNADPKAPDRQIGFVVVNFKLGQ